MPFIIKPGSYTIEATATKRELQELEQLLDKYIDENQHTSGYNPAYQFMKEFLVEIDKAVYGREKRKNRKTLSVGNLDDGSIDLLVDLHKEFLVEDDDSL